MSRSKGGYKMTWKGDRVKEVAHKAAFEGLRDCGYAVLADASNLVPHDEGQLENSGDIFADEENLTVTIFFETPYAVKQHEDMTARHANGREAKYLEKPLKERGPELTTYVADKVREALKQQ